MTSRFALRRAIGRIDIVLLGFDTRHDYVQVKPESRGRASHSEHSAVTPVLAEWVLGMIAE
ncbi:hypothetical protein [Nocardia sp. NPDC057440]|uniref:hypothetical protein n=1 Tax=Nocardia sp. NPDC057440 TaxID=3346134 RepID=UPI003670D08E